MGKCAGTQSRITPSPAAWARSTKRAKASGSPMAPRRREQADRLIAPRLVERMLADRQQLEMGEAEIGGVGDQLIRELVVAQEAIVFAPPP